jgi:transcription elongation GreA/GreB family factor
MSDILRLDQKGYEDFLAEIEELEKELKDIRYYKGTDVIYQGDLWHDNPALDNAEMQERMLMRSIKIIKAQLRYIKIIEKGPDSGMADLGSICLLNIVFPDGREDEKKIKLVGTSSDMNAEIQEVSLNSPMGSAIYGKRENESGSYEVNGKIIKVHLKKIIT